MTPRWLGQSVVVRLALCLVGGGLALSVGLSVLELRRAQNLLRMEVTQHTAMTARGVQQTVGRLIEEMPAPSLAQTLNLFASDPYVLGLRLRDAQGAVHETGVWPDQLVRTAVVWNLPAHGIAVGQEVDLQRPTLVRAPMRVADHSVEIELLIDTPAARGELHRRLLAGLAAQWLLLAVLTLLGLLLLRRWFTGPLSDVAALIDGGAPADSFYDLARHHHGEFARLGQAIGGMLTRIDATAQRLRQREAAFEDLYQHAPAAMVSLDPAGRIVAANQRAAELFAVGHEGALVGQAVLDFICREDRALLRQTIDRLELDGSARCDLRVRAGDRTLDATVECSGLRDEEGTLRQVRLSLVDVSRSRQLQRQLADKSRLLDLVIDHMSDAILVVDQENRVAACNQKLGAILSRRPEQILGETYDPRQFWAELGLANADLFVSRMRQIEADAARRAQERVHTRLGAMLFEGVPIHDGEDAPVGRLWIVQDISHEEQVQTLLRQQTAQLQSLRRLGQRLAAVSDLEALIERVCLHVFEALKVDAAGLAVLDPAAPAGIRQLVHSGPAPALVAQARQLATAVAVHLLPEAIGHHDVLYWPDLPPAKPWAAAFYQAGLTSLATAPLRASDRSHGVLWIARRGGERLDRHQVHLLQALVPLVAARVEFVQLRQKLACLAPDGDVPAVSAPSITPN